MTESNVEELIKQYEPMMHKILHKYNVKNDYEDNLQELRITAWETFTKHNSTDYKMTTILYRRLEQRMINILKVDYRIKKPSKNGEYSLKEQSEYNLKNPRFFEDLSFEQLMTILEKDVTADGIRFKIDFNEFLDSLNEEDREIFILRESGMSQAKIAKQFNLGQATIVRRLNSIKDRFKIFMKGED